MPALQIVFMRQRNNTPPTHGRISIDTKMTTRNRCQAFAGITLTTCIAQQYWLSYVQPLHAGETGVAQLNGASAAWGNLLHWQIAQHNLALLPELIILAAGLILLGPPAIRHLRQQLHRPSLTRLIRRIAPVFIAIAALSLGACKPYDKPEYAEIDTSETGFLIPLEGDGTKQARFESVDYLTERKVAAKRVQITHRWSQEGRLPFSGQWMSSVRLVKVNRSPVTREWIAEAKTSDGNKAIWIESADSVGFSMGFTCTAFIDEKSAATFLYWYPSGSLASVMDTEVRGRIQQTSAEVAAKYPLDLLRGKKQEIADAVKADVISFFAPRGITVTTVGMFGGMTYENAAIQKSIDDTFIAQQLKVVTAAKFEAQQKENDRVELEAKATAERVRLEARGNSDARLMAAKADAESRLTQAKAEAEAIRMVNDAVANSGPLLMQIRALEVERARVERWNGSFPQTMLGSNPNMLFTSPLAAPVAETR